MTGVKWHTNRRPLACETKGSKQHSASKAGMRRNSLELMNARTQGTQRTGTKAVSTTMLGKVCCKAKGRTPDGNISELRPNPSLETEGTHGRSILSPLHFVIKMRHICKCMGQQRTEGMGRPTEQSLIGEMPRTLKKNGKEGEGVEPQPRSKMAGL